MNKFLGLIVILLVLVFSGCATDQIEVPSNLNQKSNEVETSLKVDSDKIVETNIEDSPMINDEEKGASIQELLDRNEGVKCTWRVEKQEVIEDADNENLDEEATGGIEEGVFYADQGRFKQEIKIKENTRENLVNLLSDGENIYQWNTITPQGTYVALGKAGEIEIINLNKKNNWECEVWSDLDFNWEVPADLEFIKLISY